MIKVLWILNKYVDGQNHSQFYPYFLADLEKECLSKEIQLEFTYFSDAQKKCDRTQHHHFFFEHHRKITDFHREAARIENEYNFTLNHAYYSDIIQVTKTQDTRRITVPEKELNNHQLLVEKFVYLENLVKKNGYDVIFCDQSPEAEAEFGRVIALKNNLVFIRHGEGFLANSLFSQQFEFGKERLSEAVLNTDVTLEQAKEFVRDFIKNKRPPYQYPETHKASALKFYSARIAHFYRYPNFIKMALSQPWLWFEEKWLKRRLEKQFDPTASYLFLGLQLPTESTIVLRSQPYANQSLIIEAISRVLPDNTLLYVREHPKWRKHFPARFLGQIASLPNVRLISPQIPAWEVIHHAKAVLTYNSTIGIEALMHGKPVLSFAPNVYINQHPAVTLCTNLYDLDHSLAKLVNTKVEIEDTYKYIYKMMRISSWVPLWASGFLSEDDAQKKAGVFSQHLLLAIKDCQNWQKNNGHLR
ncbi:MAG: hypothetical protein WC773_03295 [Patescibacteria group bacterium]